MITDHVNLICIHYVVTIAQIIYYSGHRLRMLPFMSLGLRVTDVFYYILPNW